MKNYGKLIFKTFQLFKSECVRCSFVEFLDEEAKSDVLKTVDWILSLQLKNGNFPSKVEEERVDRGENELVHWCHGATGAVHLMIVAYLRTRNAKYLKVSLLRYFACVPYILCHLITW